MTLNVFFNPFLYTIKFYNLMKYRYCGKSGLQMPVVSLGLWHNFGDADDFGLAYSVEAGLKYDVCESAYIIGSVGFNGVWTTPDWEGGYNDGQQTGIIVSLGVGYKF